MNLPDHAFGCTCARHAGRPWRRPEHWTRDEVAYLEGRFGSQSDAAIAKHLGRSVLGVRLKAKRLGLHKRDAGVSARQVALIFGIDETVASKVWIRRGLLRSRRPFYQGPHPIHLVAEVNVERFIREHPEYIDVEKMPESCYRDLAARDPWISLTEVHRLTGRNRHAVSLLIRAGELHGAKRGAHWYMPRSQVARIRHLAPERIAESVWRREVVLERRRAARKGVAPAGVALPPGLWLAPLKPRRDDSRRVARAARNRELEQLVRDVAGGGETQVWPIETPKPSTLRAAIRAVLVRASIENVFVHQRAAYPGVLLLSRRPLPA